MVDNQRERVTADQGMICVLGGDHIEQPWAQTAQNVIVDTHTNPCSVQLRKRDRVEGDLGARMQPFDCSGGQLTRRAWSRRELLGTHEFSVGPGSTPPRAARLYPTGCDAVTLWGCRRGCDSGAGRHGCETMNASKGAPMQTMNDHVRVADRAGLSEESFAGQRRAGTQQIVPGLTVCPDGELIVGICYRTDFDATQEYGLGELAQVLTSKDPRRFQMVPTAATHVAVFDDVNGFALSKRPLPATLAWGDPLPGWYDSGEYVSWWNNQLAWAREYDELPLRRMKVADIRAELAAAGITPLPRLRGELEEAWRAWKAATADEQIAWPAYFGAGETLVFRADTGPTAKVVAALTEAAKAGTLGVGSASSPFSTGMFFYDTRDETDALVTQREAAFDEYDSRMADLAPVEAELKARGHRFYFLGNPSELDTDDGDVKIRYFLNGSGDPQPSGWYTLDELLAEKFVTDAAERHAARHAGR